MPKTISKSVWGLDISASAVKAVQMRMEGERVELLDAEIIPYEGPEPAEDAPGRDRRIWQALQRFNELHRVGRARVAVGLPGSIFFMRPFNIFLVGDRSEAELVRFEMEQQIPFGLDAVLWDYEMFRPLEAGARDRQGLLFAIKKEVLNNYLLSLSASDIEPAQLQAAPLALYNFIRHELQPEAPMLVADIGAASTTLLAISGERYWLRTLNIGGAFMTAAVQNAFRPREVSVKDAEEMKRSLRLLSRRGELIEKVVPAMRGFVGEVRNGINLLKQEHKLSFERLVLVGGGSAMYGLPRLLGDELKLRVVVPAGLGRIELAESVDPAYIHGNLPVLATAMGLGLQALGQAATRVNMVGATLVERRSQTMVRRSAVMGAVVALLLVLLLGAFASWRAVAYRKAADQMRTDLLGPVSQRWNQFKKLEGRGDAEKWLDGVRDMAASRSLCLLVLDKVARVLPDDNNSPSTAGTRKVWLISLSLKPKPNAPGTYEGTLEAGTLWRLDGQHAAFARTTLKTPLEGDTSGMFRNVTETGAGPSATLSFPGGGGNRTYYVVQMRFDVLPPAEEAP